MKHNKQYEYDVAISYAGEDREYADGLANALRVRGVKIFYDQYEQADLWGKNLYTHLTDLYQNKARYCVMFLSKHYAAKLWTNHERQAVQARAFRENEEYILPVRLDNTEIPGILPTIAYLRCPPETTETIADAVMTKLGKSSQKYTADVSQTRSSIHPDMNTATINPMQNSRTTKFGESIRNYSGAQATGKG